MNSPEARPWKRRRRRRSLIDPVSAKLHIEERSKGDVGTISLSLHGQLYGKIEDDATDQICYVAVSLWRPTSLRSYKDFSWTILPVRLEQSIGPSEVIHFPSSSLCLQSFVRILQASRIETRSRAGIEVVVLDVLPLELETVVVKIDGKALKKHDEVQKRFGGGFLNSNKTDQPLKAKSKSIAPKGFDFDLAVGHRQISSVDAQVWDSEARLKAAVRSSLSSTAVLHSNDVIPLPLPSHPITHVPFPPLHVVTAMPVLQGLVSLQTEVIIEVDYVSKGSKQKAVESMATATTNKSGVRRILEEDEDTTELFYSATEHEDDNICDDQADSSANGSTLPSETSENDEGSLSDDSADDIISLNSPILPPQASGILSSRNAATPRARGGMMNGISTPGSIASNYTSTTAHQSVYTGRAFSLKPLVAKVPDAILHPRPALDEDSEARVFVDLKMLVRLGCFSGEWVKLIAKSDSNVSDDRFWFVGSFDNDEVSETFRPVKIYGLSDIGYNEIPQYPKGNHARRQSITTLVPSTRTLPCAYISPILFANLGHSAYVTIVPLLGFEQRDKKFSKPRLSFSATPPIAKELTLFRINTPAANERAASLGIFANLKHYFESRRRLVKEGDLIAINVDAVTSRILSNGGSNLEVDSDLEELLLQPDFDVPPDEGATIVAWFKIGRISGLYTDEMLPGLEIDAWGEVASAEPLTTKMVQAGSECVKVPSLQKNPWPFYLGARKCSKPLYKRSKFIFTQDDILKPYVSPLRQRITELLAASTSPEASRLKVKPLSLLLYSTQRGNGKSYLVSSACADLGLHFYPIDSYNVLSDGGTGGDVKTIGYLGKKVEFAMDCGRLLTVPLIRQVEALTAERMATAIQDALLEVKAIVFTTADREKIPESVRSLFTHEIEVPAPDEDEREGILRTVIDEAGIDLGYDVDLASIALKTAALVARDLVDVVQRASVARQERLEALASRSAGCIVRDAVVSGGPDSQCATKSDFDVAIEAVRTNFADAIGAPKIPNVTWDDVGGLTRVKDAVVETIQLPLERPELFSRGMKKRSGILFYGPPGTGKTLLAKAIATEFSLNFFSVKGPELLNMYIGESEANVRRVFQKARDARPCVVFFDELDSVAPKRGNQGDSGGVMDRIVSQLLAELDGMSGGEETSGGVFVIGATNRPDLLDQALLRPGRFDKMLYLGVSDTHDKQFTILEALTRKFTLDPGLSLRRVAENLPLTYTGADLYALCSDAMLKAITRKASAVDAKIKSLPGGPVSIAYFFDHFASEDDTAVTVTERDFFEAQGELVSSVSIKELEHYQRVREAFESSTALEGSDKERAVVVGTPPAIEDRVLPTFKTKLKTHLDPKGKGKAIRHSTDAMTDDDADDDDAYITSNDYSTPQRYRTANGGKWGGTDNGKGKEVARDGFESEEDEDLYV